MHFTCILWLDEKPIYTVVFPYDAGFRIRVWSREWESLHFQEGQPVTAKMPGGSIHSLLIANVTRLPESSESLGGDSWVHLAAPVKSRKHSRPRG